MSVITKDIEFWKDCDGIRVIDPLDERDIAKLAKLIPDDDYPFFRVELDNDYFRMIDKETLQEINDIGIEEMVELFNKDPTNYSLVKNMSRCVSLGGKANGGTNVPIVVYKSSLEYIRNLAPLTNWVIITDDDCDQVSEGMNAFNLIDSFSNYSLRTDVFIIANNRDDCWLVDGETGEKVCITYENTEIALMVCEPDEINFNVALEHLIRYGYICYM